MRDQVGVRREDAELVAAVLAGRPELFAELVDRHAAAVLRIVRAGVDQPADAEDLAQEVFLASFLALARLRDPGRYRAHLLSIAARKVADHLRRKSRRRAPLTLEWDPPAPRPQPPAAIPAAVDEVVSALPPDARLVFALRHHEGLSCVRIARLLELKEGTVYSRLSRIHAAIRRAVEVKDR